MTTATRKRRTLEERIQDEKQKLAELESKLSIQNIEQAFDEGQVASENEAEFKALKRELASVKKVIKAGERHENDEVVLTLNSFRAVLTDRMAELVNDNDE